MRTQVWIVIATYVLVAIVRKRLENDHELYTILQILSISPFEKVPLSQPLTRTAYTLKDGHIRNQVALFNF